jgi:hypothetical protein
MWYRLVLSAREVTDKEGERVVHQTPAQYNKPIWIFDDPDKNSGSAPGIGAESQYFGPGHYTAQSPAVNKGYKDYGWDFRREERLPKGTRIIHYDELLPEEKIAIIQAANKELGKNVNVNSKVENLRDIGRLFEDPQLILLYPILMRMGYDAVEHNVGRNTATKLKENMELLKTDPEYHDKDGNLLKGKLRKHLKRSFDTNVIVINRAIITMPDLFQRVRFRPDSVSPEEMKKYRNEQQTTELEYYEELLTSGADIKLKPDVIIRLLDGGVDPNLVMNRIDFRYVGEKDIYGLLELIKKGLDPNSFFENFDWYHIRLRNTKTKIEIAKKLAEIYGEKILFKIFSPIEIYNNRSLIRANLGKYLGKEFSSSIQKVLTQMDSEKKLLSLCYNLSSITCLNYFCKEKFENNVQNVCPKCGTVGRERNYTIKPNLSLEEISQGLAIINNFDYEAKDPKDLASFSREDLKKQAANYIKSITDQIRNCSSSDELSKIYNQYQKYFENFGIDYYSRFKEEATHKMRMLELYGDKSSTLRNMIDTQAVNQEQYIPQDTQPEPKVAYKILQKTAGKVKYYYFNGESKPLRDHLQDIFPYANSVDIFYMMGRLRNKAMSDDQVANLLYEAAMGRLFPRFEDKRDVV